MSEHKDYKLKSGNILRVEQDMDAQSPDTWENEDVFLVYEHRNFTVRREGFEPRDIFEYKGNQPKFELIGETPDNIQLHKRDDRFDDYFIFPVDAYIHSGVHLSLAGSRDYPDRRWDVSTTGFVLVKKEEVVEGKKPVITIEEARKYAEGLLETWNQYLSGDVWGFTVLKPVTQYTITEEDLKNLRQEEEYVSGDYMHVDQFLEVASESTDYEELDSCWGFYGSDPKENGMLDHINDEIIEENNQVST